jgi:hypothetical protein
MSIQAHRQDDMHRRIGGFTGGLLFDSLRAKRIYLVFCFVILVLVVVSLIRRALPPEDERVPLTDSI